MRVGVEVGGTFTDLIAVSDGQVTVHKVPSTPDAPERGAGNALAQLTDDLSTVDDLVHGSTVATNAILERKGARVCLVVTAGTRDILYLQRHNRRDIYDLHYRKPQPVVSRADTFEVRERIAPDGGIVTTLDLDHARTTLRKALEAGEYGGVGICLLNSYASEVHERQLEVLIGEIAPDLPVSCSVDIMPVFREYERCSTTALAAYVQPVIAAYLSRFEASLGQGGFEGRFSVMQSNGGRLPSRAMSKNAITSLFSGPAAGVVGAARQAARAGYEDVITFDMGGTSTDVCLVEAGGAQIVSETEVDGLPVKTPVLDIATVGAGGGSIVWIDDGDMLRVGPKSAGAQPGPACYGRGGEQPTITDAHVLRGTVRPQTFLGGRMAVDVQAASKAFTELAATLGVTPIEAADSAIRIAEANIVRAIQRISTERGKDPRDYALVAFGGAGPMQAARVAEELGLTTVIVPPHAGVLSAYGLLVSDYVHYESLTRLTPVDAQHMPQLRETVVQLEGQVSTFFKSLELSADPTLSATLEMRYQTQAFEIPVPVDAEILHRADARELAELFRRAHHEVFEFDEGIERPCEIVSVRIGGAVPPDELPVEVLPEADRANPTPHLLYEHGRAVEGACVSRANVTNIAGAAIIEDGTSTIFLPEGWRATTHASGSLLLTRPD